MMDTLRELVYWGQAVLIPVLGVVLFLASVLGILASVLGTREK